MANEQSGRFHTMRQQVQDANSALENIRTLTEELEAVKNDSSEQGEQLQRIQFYAGQAVSCLDEIYNTAKRSRSFQAQQHQEHGDS